MNAIYGIDFGGTNLRIGKVNPETGELLKKPVSVPMNSIKTNDELTKIILSHVKDAKRIGISAAGDVDEKNLILKKSPNSRIKGGITFGKILKQKGYDIVMCNDLKAASQGIARYGEGKHYENVLVATYSSGFNCAVCRNKINITTSELGHMIYEPDSHLFCGCGGTGHLEIFVSGNGAASMAKQYFLITKQRDHPILKLSLGAYNKTIRKKYNLGDLQNPDVFAVIVASIGSKQIYQAYRKYPKDEPQKHIRNTQVEAIADSFGRMVGVFNPIDIMVLMGSQTKDKDLLFDPAIKLYAKSNDQYQLGTLAKPKIAVTKLEDIGLIGAVGHFISKKAL
ncbi:MAG: hypothetical protein DRN66_03055 [Candidatus Nanohalarchaeota archaeon]|nr:MAG: hypothetical protein DRN66_03055 [Candidatus Nanohaloarchaeota archaeon]